MDIKKIDIKTWFIIILGIALIISFFFGQRSHIDTHKDEITTLHVSNADLLHKNDSLKAINVKLDGAISDINKLLVINTKNLSDTQLELENLKKRKNETPIFVSHLSATGISNAFSDYLNHTKGTNNR